MARKTNPTFECMEQRMLLSGLSGTITTSQSTYQVGQPIDFKLTETNKTSAPINYTEDGTNMPFNVEQNGTLVWSSVNPDAIHPIAIADLVLAPGQSFTTTAEWNGVAGNGSDLSAQNQSSPIAVSQTSLGSFTVSNGFDPSAQPVTFQIESPLSYALKVDQSQTSSNLITLTYTITNASAAPITVNVPASDFTIANTFGVIDDTNPQASSQPPQTQTIQPGQSITQTASWNDAAYVSTTGGQFTFNSLTASVPDAATSLDVDFSLAPQTSGSTAPTSTTKVPDGPPATTINPPVAASPVISVITSAPAPAHDSPSTTTYKLNQPIQFRVSLVNGSQNTVELKDPSKRIEITIVHDGKIVWRKAKVSHGKAAKTLAAGRSLDVSFVWNGKPNQPGVKKLAAGTYTVEVQEDGYLAQTSFETVI